MLRYINYDIVFQEIPGEVTLAINISNCPNHCKGCHSPYLWEDRGNLLDQDALIELLKKYGNSITCICFMGGDSNPSEIERLATFVKKYTRGNIKTGWYSGKNTLPPGYVFHAFDYIKLGAYVEKLGGLKSLTTNQRFYKIEQDKMIDITHLFQAQPFSD